MASEGPNSPGTVVEEFSVGSIVWVDEDNAKVSDDVYAETNMLEGGP